MNAVTPIAFVAPNLSIPTSVHDLCGLLALAHSDYLTAACDAHARQEFDASSMPGYAYARAMKRAQDIETALAGSGRLRMAAELSVATAAIPAFHTPVEWLA